MGGYLTNFIVYTTAMVGIIFLAVWIYKKFSFCNVSQSKFLNVEDCISLAPRKNLYVVRAGNERFLVASDAERTSLISKLGDNSTNIIPETPQSSEFSNNENKSIDDLPNITVLPKRKGSKKVFKNIINNI